MKKLIDKKSADLILYDKKNGNTGKNFKFQLFQILLTVIIISLIANNTFSVNQPKKDSILSVLKKSGDIAQHAALLHSLSEIYIGTNIDSAMYYIRKAIKIQKQDDDYPGLFPRKTTC